MTKDVEYLSSAFKHGFTEEDAEYVMRSTNTYPATVVYEEGSGELGYRVLFVGFTESGVLVDVIVEFTEDDRCICFHIDKASKRSVEIYE